MNQEPGLGVNDEIINGDARRTTIEDALPIDDETKALDTPEKQRNFAEKLADRLVDFIRKPTKKARIMMGIIAFLGAGYLERDKIMELGDIIIRTPIVTKVFDDQAAEGYVVNDDERLSPDSVSVLTKKDANGHDELAIRINDIDVNICYGLYSNTDEDLANDTGKEIKIDDPQLSNILESNSKYVTGPKDEAAFDDFIQLQIKKFTTGEHAPIASDDLEKGDVMSFVELVDLIVKNNLKYDKATSAWVKSNDDDRMEFRWGGTNPVRAIWSTDNASVDDLLMKSNEGICRQFSDCTILVAEEIKKLYPDRFQNVKIVSFANSYQWHVYNLVFVVRNNNGKIELDSLEVEPQTTDLGVPAYELIKMMSQRNIITKSQQLDILIKLLETPKTNNDREDVFAILEEASNQKRNDVIEAVKKHATSGGLDFDILNYMLRKDYINGSEYGASLIEYANSTSIISESDIEKLFVLAEKNKEISNDIYSALKTILLGSGYEKLPRMNFFEHIEKMRKMGLISDQEYFQFGKKIYEKTAFEDDGAFVRYLLKNDEYLPLARHYIVEEFNVSANYPTQLIGLYGKADGEYYNWTKDDFLNFPPKSFARYVGNYADILKIYKDKTHEDLRKLMQDRFDENMKLLEASLKNSK